MSEWLQIGGDEVQIFWSFQKVWLARPILNFVGVRLINPMLPMFWTQRITPGRCEPLGGRYSGLQTLTTQASRILQARFGQIPRKIFCMWCSNCQRTGVLNFNCQKQRVRSSKSYFNTSKKTESKTFSTLPSVLIMMMMMMTIIDWHCQVCCPTRHCVLIVAPTRIALTLFVYIRTYFTSTCTDCTDCRVELAHLA